MPLTLIFSLLIGLSSLAQAEEDTAYLFKSVSKGCMREMATKIIQASVAKAYCYCYTDHLLKSFTEIDFERMGQDGVSKNDRKQFKIARKACKPDKKK